MERTPTPPAFEKPPYYVGLSQCDGVHGGEEHWAVLADDCRGIVADVEGGLTLSAKARADFIVRACNSHDALLDSLYGARLNLADVRELLADAETVAAINRSLERIDDVIASARGTTA